MNDKLEEIRQAAYEPPTRLEKASYNGSRLMRGVFNFLKPVPTAAIIAVASAMLGVEILMVAVGWRDMQANSLGVIAGGTLPVVFVFFYHQFMRALRTATPWDNIGWGLSSLGLFVFIFVGYFFTQINNASEGYRAADERSIERSQLMREIDAQRRVVQSLQPTAAQSFMAEGDQLELETVISTASRWDIQSFDDCAREGGFSRQMQVDLCNRWGELRVSIADAENAAAALAEQEAKLAGLRESLEALPAIRGNSAWKEIAGAVGQEVSVARAIVLAVASAFFMLITAALWHIILERLFGSAKK